MVQDDLEPWQTEEQIERQEKEMNEYMAISCKYL